jgi:HNH endonuclease
VIERRDVTPNEIWESGRLTTGGLFLWRRSVNREEGLAAITECARQLGRAPSLREFQRFKPVKIHAIRKLFGSWEGAVKAAGLEQAGIKTRITGEDILAAIEDCARTLGRVPGLAEFKLMKGISVRKVIACFGNWTNALRACEMAPSKGIPVPIEAVLEEWAALARKLERLPTVTEFEMETRHSVRTVCKVTGKWTDVPRAFVEYAQAQGLESGWADVLAIIQRKPIAGTRAAIRSSATAAPWLSKPAGNTPEAALQTQPPRNLRLPLLPDRKVYGPAFTPLPMVYAPVNEMGVVLLFGALARHLGFIITWIGTAFPDAEAMREVAPGKLQPVRIEFEHESRNFLKHLHNCAECDLIVCWIHNWPECPLEVVELVKAVNFQF